MRRFEVPVLPDGTRALVADLIDALTTLPGVQAVVLGGSYARGTARPDSDVDLGLYYAESAPLVPDEVRTIARRFAQEEPTVTQLYEWGPWVNGGAWIHTSAGKVDLLYRNIDHVQRVIDAAHAGRVEWHFGQQPPYGFHTVIYLAETHACVPVHDSRGVIASLKRAVATYPRLLRETIVREFLWGAEFSLILGRKFAAAGDVYDTVGCITRAASQLTQVLFAVNEAYFMTDKGALEAIDALARRPIAYSGRVRAALSHPGQTAEQLKATVYALEELVADVVRLVGDQYRPKYRL